MPSLEHWGYLIKPDSREVDKTKLYLLDAEGCAGVVKIYKASKDNFVFEDCSEDAYWIVKTREQAKQALHEAIDWIDRQ